MKLKNIITVTVFSLIILSAFVICILKPEAEYSDAERRYLAKLPEVSAQIIFEGSFTKDFEKYTTDQFFMRDKFRTLKALFSKNVFFKKDNNGLFVKEGHISKIDDVQNDYMVNYACDLFTKIKDKYFKDNQNVYLSVIPDKNFILSEKYSYPALDYVSFTENIKEKLSYMKYIDVSKCLELSDYYTTDTHWKQEEIIDVAGRILNSLGLEQKAKYDINELDIPFYGVYYGQLALPFEPDTIKYLTNDDLKNAKVTYYDTGMPKKGDMYNMKKANGKDPYEMFLSGSTPLVTIENENASSDRHLIIFRDSFAGSLAPLLSEGYQKITLVDLRYVQSDFIGGLVDFTGADILFMYSSTLINNSTSMK